MRLTEFHLNRHSGLARVRVRHKHTFPLDPLGFCGFEIPHSRAGMNKKKGRRVQSLRFRVKLKIQKSPNAKSRHPRSVKKGVKIGFMIGLKIVTRRDSLPSLSRKKADQKKVLVSVRSVRSSATRSDPGTLELFECQRPLDRKLKLSLSFILPPTRLAAQQSQASSLDVRSQVICSHHPP